MMYCRWRGVGEEDDSLWLGGRVLCLSCITCWCKLNSMLTSVSAHENIKRSSIVDVGETEAT